MEIERRDDLVEIRRERVVVVSHGRLARLPESAAVVRDDAITRGQQR